MRRSLSWMFLLLKRTRRPLSNSTSQIQRALPVLYCHPKNSCRDRNCASPRQTFVEADVLRTVTKADCYWRKMGQRNGTGEQRLLKKPEGSGLPLRCHCRNESALKLAMMSPLPFFLSVPPPFFFLLFHCLWRTTWGQNPELKGRKIFSLELVDVCLRATL